MLQQIATQATQLQRAAYVISLKKLGIVNATEDEHEENTTEDACGSAAGGRKDRPLTDTPCCRLQTGYHQLTRIFPENQLRGRWYRRRW